MFEKKNGKRFLASVMALVMLLSLAPVGALATEDEGQPAENQAVVDTGDTNENTPTEPTKDSDSAEATKSEGGVDEGFSADTDDADTSNDIAVQNLSLNKAPKKHSITAEYWVTNGRASVDGNQSMVINSADFSDNQEKSISEIAPGEGAFPGDQKAVFRFAKVLTGNQKQKEFQEDRTSDTYGKKVESIRYNSSTQKFQYKATDGNWYTFNSHNDQLVFYYLIKTNFVKEISVYITDWPTVEKTNESQYQVNYEVWELPNKDSELTEAIRLEEPTETYYNKDMTVSAIKVAMNDSEQYFVHKVTVDSKNNENKSELTAKNSEVTFSLNLANADSLARNKQITIKIYVTAYKYQLNYEANGGNINDSNYSEAGSYLPNAPIIAPMNVTKTGYTFAGWYTDEECTEGNEWTDSTDSKMPSENLILYAKWDKNSYTVTYKDGDTQSNGVDTVEYNDKVAVRAGLTKEGCIFNGWKSDANNTIYSPGQTFTMPDKDVTLTAQWTKTDSPVVPSTLVKAKFFINLDGKDASNPYGKGDFTKGVEIKNAINLTIFDREKREDISTNKGYIFDINGVEKNLKYTGLLNQKPEDTAINDDINAELPTDKRGSMDIGPDTSREVVWYHVSLCSDGYHVDGYIKNVDITITYDPNGGQLDAEKQVKGKSGQEHQIIETVPTKSGYVFAGWKVNGDSSAKIYKHGESITPMSDLTLVAQWEKDTLVDPSANKPEGITKGDGIADKYQIQVSFEAMNGTFEGCTSPDNQYTTVVTKYDNSTNMPSENGTAKLANEHLKAATPNENHNLTGWTKNSTKCEIPKLNDIVTHGDHFVVTFEKKENPPIVEPTTKINYTINQYFMNGKGEKDSALDKPGTTQSADKDTALSELIKNLAKDQTIGNDKDNYMYVSGKYTTKSESQKDQLITSESKLTEDTTIDLYYYLDNWKDGDSKTPTESDSETDGDGIPDCYQVLVKYQSGDLIKGKIADNARTQEVLTIRVDKQPANKGTVTASGSTATATGSRCYFVNWTNKDNTQVGPKATLGELPFDAVGGETYTFTANFDRSSGGGSGGSNRPKPPVVDIPDDVPTGLNGKDHYAYIIGYGNNDVRPQNNITRAEVATIFFRLLTDETRTANMTKSNSYNDVKDGDWFCCAVSTLSKMGIIKGYEDGSFKPNDPISRAEFAAIAARFDPDGDKTPASFSDVTSHWAKDEISIAANHGWIKGYEDGSFKPDQKITRAETMTLVNRVLNRLPEAKDDLHKDMKTWVDNMDETAWYYLAVQEATNSHYFKNKTSTKFEQWTDLRDTRDWSELEK